MNDIDHSIRNASFFRIGYSRLVVPLLCYINQYRRIQFPEAVKQEEERSRLSADADDPEGGDKGAALAAGRLATAGDAGSPPPALKSVPQKKAAGTAAGAPPRNFKDVSNGNAGRIFCQRENAAVRGRPGTLPRTKARRRRAPHDRNAPTAPGGGTPCRRGLRLKPPWRGPSAPAGFPAWPCSVRRHRHLRR